MNAYGDISKKQIEVEHNYFNFLPLIRKTKIDLYLERAPDPASTASMDFIGKNALTDHIHPSNFNAFPDLLLA